MKFILSLSIVLLLAYGCTQTDPEYEPMPATTSTVILSVNQNWGTRVSSDIGTAIQTVNRILAVPFQKINPSLSDDNTANFVPAWNFVRQYDIDAFPVNSLKLSLAESFTYKVLLIGFNRNDYDYTRPNASTNRFILSNQPSPANLGNFRLFPKAPNEVPEFFTSFCIAQSNGTTIGTVFTPTNSTTISLSGNLKRIVSGLGIYITNVPAYVKSITLTAENLVKATQLYDTTAIITQHTGDGESRIIRQLTPTGGQVRFNEFLLPTNDNGKTLLYLDVTYGTTTTRYMIKVPDSPVSSSNKIRLFPNGTVTITGDFSQTGIGFQIDRNINLDDDAWDGLQ